MCNEVRGKVIVIARPGHAELRNAVRLPDIDSDSIVIKNRYSGISRGTEMDLYHCQLHDYGQFYPLITGYEPVGEVVEIGKDVSSYCVGDRVAASNIFAGYEEGYCCAWGGQSEYIVLNYSTQPQYGAALAVKIPDSVTYQEALISCLGGVALHGIERIGEVTGKTVAVIGQGVVGNMAAQICRAMGARVIVTDLYEYRLDISQDVGIEETVNASTDDQERLLLKKTNGGPDVVIEATGEIANLDMAIRVVRDDGKVHAQGMYLEPYRMYIPETLFRKNLSFSSSCGQEPRHQARILDMISDGQIQAKSLLSRQFSIDEATRAYETADKEPDKFLKIFFAWE